MNGLAKGCPAAMCPHLSAVAQQVQALWEGDGLRVGEYVVLCEGLVAAAAAGGDATLQSQVCPRRTCRYAYLHPSLLQCPQASRASRGTTPPE